MTDSYDPAVEAEVDHRIAEMLREGLTIDEAVRIALLSNWSFQSLFQDIGASRADVVQSGLLSNPVFSLSIQFPEGGGLNKLSASFAQQIVDLWQIPVRKKVAEAQLEQTVLNVARAGIDLAANTEADFYRLAAAERAEEIALENVKLIERSVRLAEKRLESGEVGVLDVKLSRLNLVDVNLELIAVRREKEVARAELAQTLGLSRWRESWAIVAPPKPQPLTDIDDVTLMRLALDERLEARMAAYRVDAAENELVREYLAVFPSVAIGPDLERGDRRALPGRQILADTARASIRKGQLTAPDIQTRGERDLIRRQIIDVVLGPSITATLPIWDQNQAQIAKAKFNVIQRRKDWQATLDVIARDVQTALAKALTGAQQVRYLEEQGLPQTRQVIESSERAYTAGEQGILALIEAQKALIRQQRAYVDVMRDSAVARAELERAVGGRWPTSTSQPAASQRDAGEPSSPAHGPETEP